MRRDVQQKTDFLMRQPFEDRQPEYPAIALRQILNQIEHLGISGEYVRLVGLRRLIVFTDFFQ